MAKTYQELKLEISQKKIELQKSDIEVLHYVEGLLTEEEFENLKTKRSSIRDEIEKLEKKLPAALKAMKAAEEEKEEQEEN